jgi:hypothetical protein
MLLWFQSVLWTHRSRRCSRLLLRLRLRLLRPKPAPTTLDSHRPLLPSPLTDSFPPCLLLKISLGLGVCRAEMSAGGEAGEKKKSLGAKAKSFFGGVKDALKDAATIDLSFDNQEARLKGTVQSEEGSRELCIFSSTVSFAVRTWNCTCCARSSSQPRSAGRRLWKDSRRTKVTVSAGLSCRTTALCCAARSLFSWFTPLICACRDGKKKVEHIGMKCQLFVRIEMYYEKTEHELSRVMPAVPCSPPFAHTARADRPHAVRKGRLDGIHRIQV